jgi:hypothetical protein
MRRVRFEWSGLAVDIWPAIPHANAIYAALAGARLRPLVLAHQLGRVSEETASRAIAEVFSEAVIAGSPSDELANLDGPGWVAWLLANPREFGLLRELAMDAATFEGGARVLEVGEVQHSAAPAAPGDPGGSAYGS